MGLFRSRRRFLDDASAVHEVIARNVLLAAALDVHERRRLEELTLELVSTKRWEPIGGVELTDEVLVTIAANAAIPILALSSDLYRAVSSIILHAGAQRSSGTRAGPVAGVVNDRPVPVAGLAAPRAGPVSLSWQTALTDSRHPERGRNVVIHELAHKIDMSDGYSDGLPPVRTTELDRWARLMDSEYYRADVRPSDAALRPYAWSSPAEFFAVSTEAFFCTPTVLADAKPELYAALADFYRQDPAGRDHGLDSDARNAGC